MPQCRREEEHRDTVVLVHGAVLPLGVEQRYSTCLQSDGLMEVGARAVRVEKGQVARGEGHELVEKIGKGYSSRKTEGEAKGRVARIVAKAEEIFVDDHVAQEFHVMKIDGVVRGCDRVRPVR